MSAPAEPNPLLDLVQSAVNALAEKPDRVAVRELKLERVTVYEISGAQGDTGKIIGKSGRNAGALRTLLQAAGGRLGRHVLLEIVD
jgi:predicted RNA-binding protein YlqC (UPF0109 family)